jgi:ABC-type multidrug transport system fused ATPase/permease subunit
LLPCARRHRRKLLLGVLMSLLVIAIRLSLPWLFRGMLEPLLSVSGAREGLALADADMGARPLLLGGSFLVLLVALGFADFLMRLKFAQFAIATVRDLRARAFQSAMQIDPRIRPSGSGDLVARLIGDTARIKEGLKGFLVHVATNGMMLAAVGLVLLWVNVALGALLAAAYALIGVVVVHGTLQVYRRALRLRKKEGRLAESIHQAWGHGAVEHSFDDINRSSGKLEATVTNLQGRATWIAHAVFGAAVLLLIWFGTRAVTSGTLPGADLLVFILYALMTRAPVVQLARQGTRTGKILACAERLEQVLRSGRKQESAAALPALERRLRIDGVKIYRPASQGGGRRLRIGELSVEAGSRVVVVGASAAGKSTLLQLLAGALPPQKGEVWWDDVSLSDVSKRTRHERIAMLSQEPRWPKQPLWHLLGLPDATLTPATLEVLKLCGARPVLRRLPRGLETVLASDRLAAGERHAFVLGRMMLADASMLLLDDPFKGLGRKKARRCLRAVLSRCGTATVIVAAHRPPSHKHFDRVIELVRGKIVFDGTPAAYRVHQGRTDPESVPATPGASVLRLQA